MNEAKYDVIYGEKCISLSISAPELDVEDGDDIRMEVNSENMILFHAPPYFLRIPAYKYIKSGEYFPDLSCSEKGIYKYTIPILEHKMESMNGKTEMNQNYYGFDSKYSGELTIQNNQDLKTLSNPEKYTQEERKRIKTRDEEHDFNPEHYGMDYVQYVIDGLSIDPYDFSYNQYPTEETRKTINALLKDGEKSLIPPIQNCKSVWLGLIDILLAVMYDKMINSNEINDVISHVNIHAITSTLSYFEEFNELKDVIKSFYRRSIIYPYYRNKDVSLKCLIALIQGFRSVKQKDWVLEKLMHAYNAFSKNDCVILNHFYIKDYIKFVSWTMSDETFLKGAADIETEHNKFRDKDIGFDLDELEEKFVKDIIGNHETNDLDSDDYSNEEEEDVDVEDSSSAFDDEGDSDSSQEYDCREDHETSDLSSIKEEDVGGEDNAEEEIAEKINKMFI